MRDDVKARLRRLGVSQGARHLTPLPKPRPQPFAPQPLEEAPLEALLPGSREVETPLGACLVLDRVYPLSHVHGTVVLQTAAQRDLARLAPLLNNPALAALNLENALFLDTETTGLWGAGVFAFLVGVGFFEGQAFVVRQYFCRDPGEEGALLTLLGALAAQRGLLVTFNGRGFDVPLLEGRYVMNRLAPLWVDMPHLDLLQPARKLWRRRLGSVALKALEAELLGIGRSEADVPGALIPAIYQEYLRSGNGAPVARVFYHNEIDILSMVTLTHQLLALVEAPQVGPGLDVLSLARWRLRQQQTAEAEGLLLDALQRDLALETYREVLWELGLLLKRTGRSSSAVAYWQQLAVTSFDDVAAHLELAKYYEWQQGELDTALSWTEQALRLVEALDAEDLLHALRHRQRRLERKLARR